MYFSAYLDARSIVFQYSFGKDCNVLGSAEEAASLRKNLTQLLRGVKVAKHFHLFFWAIKRLPLAIARHMVPPGVRNMRDLTTVSAATHQAKAPSPSTDIKRYRAFEARSIVSFPTPQIPIRLMSDPYFMIYAIIPIFLHRKRFLCDSNRRGRCWSWPVSSILHQYTQRHVPFFLSFFLFFFQSAYVRVLTRDVNLQQRNRPRKPSQFPTFTSSNSLTSCQDYVRSFKKSHPTLLLLSFSDCPTLQGSATKAIALRLA